MTYRSSLRIIFAHDFNKLFKHCFLKDKYPNFEVGLKCIIMVF